MLHNFGGRTGIFGALDSINQGFPDALSSAANLVGLGLTPEVIVVLYRLYRLLVCV
jgi:hypothetical protein